MYCDHNYISDDSSRRDHSDAALAHPAALAVGMLRKGPMCECAGADGEDARVADGTNGGNAGPRDIVMALYSYGPI